MHDASWANDDKIFDDKIFPRRSQYRRISCLGDPTLWEAEGYNIFLGWKRGIIKRMCRSTFRAEKQRFVYGMEAGVALRALIAELRGKRMRHDSEWGENCAATTMKHLWMTDCEPLHSYLTDPAAAGTENKRLESTWKAYENIYGSILMELLRITSMRTSMTRSDGSAHRP